MGIVVCIKRVPEVMSVIEVDASGTNIRKDRLVFKINDWDEYVLEEAMQLKGKLGGSVTAVTVGPPEWDDILRRALAMGADTAIRINQDMTATDSHAVAKTLAKLISCLSYDLVLFGAQSEDFASGELGPMVAEMLGIPHAVFVTKIEFLGREVKIDSELEGGASEIYTLKLPALLTIQTGINTPRYVSFSAIIRAKKRELQVMELDELGLSHDELAPLVRLERLSLPQKRKGGEIISGSAEEAAGNLAEILKDRGIL